MNKKRCLIIGLAIVSMLSLLITFNNNSQQGLKNGKYISIDPLPSSTKLEVV